MHPPSGQMKHHQTLHLSETLDVRLFDRTDKHGHGHVAIIMEQKLPDDSKITFTTDMDALETIIRHAETYQKTQERAERVEKVESYDARFSRGYSDEHGDTVGVRLEERGVEGSEPDDSFSTSLVTLKEVRDAGLAVEKELGFGRTWHQLVVRDTLKLNGEGQVEATVYINFEGLENAQKRLKDDSSLAIAPETTRRPKEIGSIIELERDDPLEIKRGVVKTVDMQMSDTQWSKERLGEKYVVAVWNDVETRPQVDQKAIYEGDSHDYRGVPQDFGARPTELGKQGWPTEPIYVLLERDDTRPFTGRIIAFSQDRTEMIGKLLQLETDHSQRQEREREHERVHTVDWNKQMLNMNRDIEM